MLINHSAVSSNQYSWLVLVAIGLVVAFIVLRFFWRHVLKYLLHGCVIVLVIAVLLALLHYFKIF